MSETDPASFRPPMYVPHVPPRPPSSSTYQDAHTLPQSQKPVWSDQTPDQASLDLSSLGDASFTSSAFLGGPGKRTSWAQLVDSAENIHTAGLVSQDPSGESSKKNRSRSPKRSEKSSVSEFILIPDSKKIEKENGDIIHRLPFKSGADSSTQANQVSSSGAAHTTGCSDTSCCWPRVCDKRRLIILAVFLVGLVLLVAVITTVIKKRQSGLKGYVYRLNDSQSSSAALSLSIKDDQATFFLVDATYFPSVETTIHFPSRLTVTQERKSLKDYCFIRHMNESSFSTTKLLWDIARNSKKYTHNSNMEPDWYWRAEELEPQRVNAVLEAHPQCKGKHLVWIEPDHSNEYNRCNRCTPVCIPRYGTIYPQWRQSHAGNDDDDKRRNVNQDQRVVTLLKKDCFWYHMPEHFGMWFGITLAPPTDIADRRNIPGGR